MYVKDSFIKMKIMLLQCILTFRKYINLQFQKSNKFQRSLSQIYYDIDPVKVKKMYTAPTINDAIIDINKTVASK